MLAIAVVSGGAWAGRHQAGRRYGASRPKMIGLALFLAF